MNRQPDFDSKSQNSRIVELAGLAGSGKTTVAKALNRQDERILIAADIGLRKKEHFQVFIADLPGLLPELFRTNKAGRRFTWDEIKALVYLSQWPDLLSKQVTNDVTIILLDHGPVFKLATLHAFGPQRLASPNSERWWQNLFKKWASTLDAVIWLDAPIPVLAQRINVRNQKHAVKGKPFENASQFLNQYKKSFDFVLTNLAEYDGPDIYKLDSNRNSIEQVVGEVLQLLRI